MLSIKELINYPSILNNVNIKDYVNETNKH